MTKKLTCTGNSLTLVLDRQLLEAPGSTLPRPSRYRRTEM